MNLTLDAVRRTLRDLGMVITHVDDEYRVNFRNGKEATAYYTNALDDALGTAFAMKAMVKPGGAA
jgi:Trm5-related predicted tRNA methylase